MTSAISPATAERSPEEGSGTTPRDKRRLALTVVAAAIPASLYVLFVVHYARNGIYWDEWDSYVPVVDNALHHHVSFSLLWQQNNENRILTPLLLVMVVGGLSHLNDLALIYLGAAFFVACFFLLLMIYPRYSGKAITPVQTLLLGVLWFSIVDTQTALYAFQLNWYLVLLGLMVLLFLLARTPVSPPVLCLAMLVCVFASFSSLQGLFLWPVGLICLLWRVRTRRKLMWSLSLWMAAALVTTFVYFSGYKFGASQTGGGSVSYAEHHLSTTMRYFLVIIGNVYPTSSPQQGFHELVGLLILLGALFVIVLSIATWRHSTSLPLPLALVVFGLLFDLSVAVGRASIAAFAGVPNRYSMPNLLILIALSVTAFVQPWSAPGHRSNRQALDARFLVTLAVCVAVAGQAILATQSGIQSAGAWRARIEAGDAVVVNLNTIPEPRRTIEFDYLVFPSLARASQSHWIQMIETDKLGELNPGTAAQYERHHSGTMRSP
jgi:hypothetical protein